MTPLWSPIPVPAWFPKLAQPLPYAQSPTQPSSQRDIPAPTTPHPFCQICIPTAPALSSGMGDKGFVRALGVVPKAGLSRRTCPARSRGMEVAGLGEHGGRGAGQRPCQERFLLQAAREGGPRRQTSRISAVTSRGRRQQCRSASLGWCSRCHPRPAGAGPGEGPRPEYAWIKPTQRWVPAWRREYSPLVPPMPGGMGDAWRPAAPLG